MSANAEIIAELRRVLNERDEARRERDSYQRQLDAIGDAIVTSITKRIEPRISRHPVTVVMAAGSLIAKIGEAIGCEFEDGDDLLEAVKELVRECDEARAACPDCAMWAERSARWHEDMQRAERERDEARREADRFRHGCTVEGDFVCPNEYAVSELTAERNFLRALKKNHEEDFTRVCKERDEARAEVERLRGIPPELPPRAPDGHGLPRYGLRWNGPSEPASVPMADGYWAPWHLASDAFRRGAEAMREACQQWCRAWEDNGEAIADALADLRVEDKP